MGRHGKKFCMICNPYGNGSKGTPGTEAIGRYYLKRETPNQFQTGWIAVCEDCAIRTEKYYEIEYFDGRKQSRLTDNNDTRIHSGRYEHDWQKENLVTIEVDGKMVDRLICSKCGAEYYRSSMKDKFPRYGCSINDEEEK